MDTKNILQSRTFWFNVATAAITYAGYLPPQYATYIVAVGNIILRFLTTQPVTLVP